MYIDSLHDVYFTVFETDIRKRNLQPLCCIIILLSVVRDEQWKNGCAGKEYLVVAFLGCTVHVTTTKNHYK